MKSQYERAIELYSKAIGKLKHEYLKELDPTNCIYFNNRSQAYFYLENFEQSLFDCNHSIALNPSYIKALNNKVQVLLEMGETSEALSLLTDIQHQYPNEISEQLLQKM